MTLILRRPSSGMLFAGFAGFHMHSIRLSGPAIAQSTCHLPYAVLGVRPHTCFAAVDTEAGNGKVSKRSIELGRVSAGSGTPPGSRRKVSPGNSRRNVTASSQGVNLTTLLASRKSIEQPDTPGVIMLPP